MELQELPNELLLEIVSLTDLQSAILLRATNKRFGALYGIPILRFSSIINSELNYHSKFYIHYDDINDESMTYLMDNCLFNPSYNKIISYRQSSKLTLEIKLAIIEHYIFDNRPNLIELLLDADNEIHISEQNVLDTMFIPEAITSEVAKVIFDRMPFTDIDLIRIIKKMRGYGYEYYGPSEDGIHNNIYKLIMKRGLNVKQVFFRYYWYGHSIETCQSFIDQGCVIEFSMVERAAESSTLYYITYEYLAFALDNADQNFINDDIITEVTKNDYSFTDKEIQEFLLRPDVISVLTNLYLE